MRGLFHGGIEPAGKKQLTSGREPQTVFRPKQVILPMRQHIGTACKPLVKLGDHVELGQKIGDGEGLCVPVHASVSGRVAVVEERPHPGGGMGLAVVIHNDGQDRPVKRRETRRETGRDYERLLKTEILRRIREGGIVGMGGAAFPTSVKAQLSEDLGSIDTLIINACECEPYITADAMLLQMYPQQVLRGAMILADVLDPLYIVVAVEDNKKEAIQSLKQALKDYPQIHLEVLPARYPQGGEKQLILAVSGFEMPSGRLAKEFGFGVFNAATCAAVCKAVDEEIPLVRRIITVTGEGINHPQNMIVPIGTPVSELIEAAGGLKASAGKVILGGPMMGVAQSTLEVPVVKGTNAVLCLAEDGAVNDSHGERLCIHCGLCVQVCPMQLQPLYLYLAGKNECREELKSFCVMDCIECGCCAYICPGKIPLVQWIRKGKQTLRGEKP